MRGRDARHDTPYEKGDHGEQENLVSWETGDGVWDEQGGESACDVSETRGQRGAMSRRFGGNGGWEAGGHQEEPSPETRRVD